MEIISFELRILLAKERKKEKEEIKAASTTKEIPQTEGVAG